MSELSSSDTVKTASSHPGMRYQREVDGLRALAVLSVIAFHAGFAWFSGGYVGVDVFFVISGYLITTLILKEKQAGTFTLLGFYERRARRILPALFVMLAVCLPFAWALLLPRELDQFCETLAAVGVFLSNVFLWINNGYFNADSELNPLLHTWTLAVEEQYYWLIPVFFVAAWRFGLRKMAWILGLAAVASLVGAEWGAYARPTATFYLLPSRAWELLIGALLAFYCSSEAARRRQGLPVGWSNAVSVLGVVLIALSVFGFTKRTPFPSIYALLPTVGAVCLIFAATARTWVGRLLGSKPVVGVGLISYSAYLWHQPLFAFTRIYTQGKLSTGLGLLVALLSLSAAYLSWRFIESPFRNRSFLSTRAVLALATLGSMTFAMLGVVGHLEHGFMNRLTQEQRAVYDFANYQPSEAYREGKCFLTSIQTFEDFAPECVPAAPANELLVVWGDSHAAALSSGLRTIMPTIVQYTSSACPPIVDTDFPLRPNCRRTNEQVLAAIVRLRPARVFLHADWMGYPLQDAPTAVKKTLMDLAKMAPSTQVTIIGSVPQWDPSLPVVMLRSRLALSPLARLPCPVYARITALDSSLGKLARAHGADFRSSVASLCNSSGCELVAQSGGRSELITWDYGHLTQAGAVALGARLLAQP